LNHATLSPEGVVQIPTSGSWMNGYFSKTTPRVLSHATVSSDIFHFPAQDGVRGGREIGTLGNADGCVAGFDHQAKGSSLTN